MAITEKYVSSLAGGGGNGNTTGTPYTLTEMVTEVNSVTGTGGQGKRYNIKADGTYSRTADDDMSSATGTAALPVSFRGYKTTIGDGYLGRASTGALITTNMPVINNTTGMFTAPKWACTESISFTSSTRNDFLVRIQDQSAIIACSVSNSATGDAGCILLNSWLVAFENDFIVTGTSSTRQTVNAGGSGIMFDSCRIITSSANSDGIRTDQYTSIYGCLIKGAGGSSGVYTDDTARPVYIRNSTITGWLNAIRYNTAMQRVGFFVGNMITDNANYGFNFSSDCPIIIGPNRMRDNVSGNNNTTPDWLNLGRIIPLVTTDTGGAATDYVNTATNDYNLIAASPGKGVNIPKISDMGPYGLADPAGGGAAVFNPLAQTIIRPAP